MFSSNVVLYWLIQRSGKNCDAGIQVGRAWSGSTFSGQLRDEGRNASAPATPEAVLEERLGDYAGPLSADWNTWSPGRSMTRPTTSRCVRPRCSGHQDLPRRGEVGEPQSSTARELTRTCGDGDLVLGARAVVCTELPQCTSPVQYGTTTWYSPERFVRFCRRRSPPARRPRCVAHASTTSSKMAPAKPQVTASQHAPPPMKSMITLFTVPLRTK